MQTRPSRLQRLHLWTGWIFVVVFLATGQYMRYFHEPTVADLEPGLRMLFRSRHIYILFAALLNLLAAYRGRAGGPGWLRGIGSGLLVLSPLLLLAAFTLETAVFAAPTPLSIYGIQAAVGGTLCHLVAGWLAGKRPSG
jgi:hypothetical protein